MVEVRALELEESPLERGHTQNGFVFHEVIDMVVFCHVPGLRSRNHPLKESGRIRTAFIDIGIPDPEPTVLFKLGIGSEPKKPAFVIGLGVGVAKARETGHVASQPADLGSKIEKHLRRIIGEQALAVKLTRLRANVEIVADDVDVCDQIDVFDNWLQLDIDVGGNPLSTDVSATG